MSMISRLLQGRLFYLIASILIAGAFIGLARLRAVEPRPHLAPKLETLEWWPSELDADRLQQLAQERPRAVLAGSLLILLMTGLAIGGSLYTLRALVTGRIRSMWRFASQQIPAWSFGELGRIIVLMLLIAAVLPLIHLGVAALTPTHGQDHHAWITISMLVLDAGLVLSILTFAGWKRRSARETIGLTRAPWAAIGVGLRGYLAAFPWLFGLLALMVEVARRFGWSMPVEPIQELVFQEDRGWVLALTLFLACVVGPLAEELFFRGVLYAALRQRISRVLAMVASSAVFSLLHTNAVGFVPIMALGYLLANVYERTGSLIAPLAVHVVHNSLLLSFALIYRHLLG